jgi:hypothetical protein
MNTVTAGGATFTPITLDEILKLLRSAFHALDQDLLVHQGEKCVDLYLNDAHTVAIRVMTSVHSDTGEGAGRGVDPIRVGFYAPKLKRPLKSGKFPIVKRTQGWKDNLRARVEDEIEDYDQKSGYWDSRAG